MTTFYLIGLIPAGLIVLAAMWILHASASEARGRNLLLYLLWVGVLCFLAIGIAALLTPQGDNRPLFQVASLLTPSLVGVLALILIQLGVLRTLRGRALLLAGLLALILVALLIPLWSHPFGFLFYMLPGALILGLTWAAAHKTGGLVIVLSLIAFVLLSSFHTDNLFAAPFFSALPAWLQAPVGYLISLLPGISAALAASLIFTGLNQDAPDENRAEGMSSLRPLAALRFLLAGLILGVLLYRIYWFSIWDHTSDGLSGLAYSMLSSLTAIGAGMIMALKSAGRARISGAAFAICIPVLVFGAFHLGWDVDYHALTEARAARIQAALERFHHRGGRYPAELAELAPREILFIPQPVIFEGEGWCYQGGVDDYRLGAVYREYFSTPLSIKIYASAGNIPDGETPDSSWGCSQRLAELQALYEPAPFFEQEIHVPTEAPLPTSQVPVSGDALKPILQGEFLRWGEWSPDGRFLPFSDVVSSQGDHFARLSFLDIETGRVCRVEEQFPLDPNPYGLELRQHFAWLPAGSFLYLTSLGDFVELSPCEGDAARPLEFEQEPFDLIATYHPDSGRALLQTSAAYWILDTESMAVRQVEAVHPNQIELHWDSFSWSPAGERLAITQLNGRDESKGSTLYVLRAENGRLELSLPLESAAKQSAPWIEWLSSHELIISGNEDLLLLDLDEGTPELSGVIKELFNLDLAYPGETAAWGSVTDETGEQYHLALRANHPRNQALYLYHSENRQVEVLDPQVHGFLIFPDGQSLEMPRFSFEREYPDKYEIFWIDQPGKEPIPLSPQGHTPRSYPRLGVDYLPGTGHMVFSSSQGISLVSLPQGVLLDFWRLSGEGHVNVLAAKNGGALVAVRERVNEADLFYIPLDF